MQVRQIARTNTKDTGGNAKIRTATKDTTVATQPKLEQAQKTPVATPIPQILNGRHKGDQDQHLPRGHKGDQGQRLPGRQLKIQ